MKHISLFSLQYQVQLGAMNVRINYCKGRGDQCDNCGPLRELCQRCHAQYRIWGDIDTIPYEYAKYYHDMAFDTAYHRDDEKSAELSRRAWVMMEMGDPTALLSNQYKLTWDLQLYQCGKAEKATHERTAIVTANQEVDVDSTCCGGPWMKCCNDVVFCAAHADCLPLHDIGIGRLQAAHCPTSVEMESPSPPRE